MSAKLSAFQEEVRSWITKNRYTIDSSSLVSILDKFTKFKYTCACGEVKERNYKNILKSEARGQCAGCKRLAENKQLTLQFPVQAKEYDRITDPQGNIYIRTRFANCWIGSNGQFVSQFGSVLAYDPYGCVCFKSEEGKLTRYLLRNIVGMYFLSFDPNDVKQELVFKNPYETKNFAVSNLLVLPCIEISELRRQRDETIKESQDLVYREETCRSIPDVPNYFVDKRGNIFMGDAKLRIGGSIEPTKEIAVYNYVENKDTNQTVRKKYKVAILVKMAFDPKPGCVKYEDYAKYKIFYKDYNTLNLHISNLHFVNLDDPSDFTKVENEENTSQAVVAESQQVLDSGSFEETEENTNILRPRKISKMDLKLQISLQKEEEKVTEVRKNITSFIQSRGCTLLTPIEKITSCSYIFSLKCKCGKLRVTNWSNIFKIGLKAKCKNCIANQRFDNSTGDHLDFIGPDGKVFKRFPGGWVNSDAVFINNFKNVISIHKQQIRVLGNKISPFTTLAKAFKIPNYQKLDEKKNTYNAVRIDITKPLSLENLRIVDPKEYYQLKLQRKNMNELPLSVEETEEETEGEEETDEDDINLEVDVNSTNLVNIQGKPFRSYVVYENGSVLTLTGRLTRGENHFSDYLRVNRIPVHRMVCFLFNPLPQFEFYHDYKKLQVNHKDGNKFNNHKDNLEWITASENMQHALQAGLLSYAQKVYAFSMNKGLISEFYAEYPSLNNASSLTNISVHNIKTMLDTKLPASNCPFFFSTQKLTLDEIMVYNQASKSFVSIKRFANCADSTKSYFEEHNFQLIEPQNYSDIQSFHTMIQFRCKCGTVRRSSLNVVVFNPTEIACRKEGKIYVPDCCDKALKRENWYANMNLQEYVDPETNECWKRYKQGWISDLGKGMSSEGKLLVLNRSTLCYSINGNSRDRSKMSEECDDPSIGRPVHIVQCLAETFGIEGVNVADHKKNTPWNVELVDPVLGYRLTNLRVVKSNNKRSSPSKND
jgi:hypothetical protein